MMVKHGNLGPHDGACDRKWGYGRTHSVLHRHPCPGPLHGAWLRPRLKKRLSLLFAALFCGLSAKMELVMYLHGDLVLGPSIDGIDTLTPRDTHPQKHTQNHTHSLPAL